MNCTNAKLCKLVQFNRNDTQTCKDAGLWCGTYPYWFTRTEPSNKLNWCPDHPRFSVTALWRAGCFWVLLVVFTVRVAVTHQVEVSMDFHPQHTILPLPKTIQNRNLLRHFCLTMFLEV